MSDEPQLYFRGRGRGLGLGDYLGEGISETIIVSYTAV